jgi:hypothetical protein
MKVSIENFAVSFIGEILTDCMVRLFAEEKLLWSRTQKPD